jgi:glycosyltransferase involved in cell wall biosynthesis
MLSLTVAGTGPDFAAARDYVERNQISGVQFAGEVSGVEKYRLLASCHAMIFPTQYGEGLPNCVLEGMLYGMPILSTENAAIPEVVAQGVNGFLTSHVDDVVFAEFIKELLTDHELYMRMARTNAETALRRFATERVRERILSIYRDTL